MPRLPSPVRDIPRRALLFAEAAGGSSALGLILIASIGIGFVPQLGGIAGYAPSTRNWLAFLLLLIALFSWWPLRRWGRAILFAVIAVGACGSTLRYAFDQDTGSASTVASLDVIEFNVLAQNTQGKDVADALVQANVDLVFIMEGEPLSPYIAQLRDVYPNIVGCGKPGDHCDLILLSKHPLDMVRWHSLSRISPDRTVTARMKVAGKSVSITAAHLTKPYFDTFEVYELIQLRGLVRKQPYPRILAGDFNSASWSPSMEEMLKRARLRPGWPEPPTWPVDFGPFGIPIDHIFSSAADTRIRDLRSFGEGLGSNHLGVQAKIDLLDVAVQ